MFDKTDDSTAPEMELDFGVGRIYVKGGEDDDLDDVEQKFKEQRDYMEKQIRELKTFERELEEEYGPDLDGVEDPLDTGRGVN